MNVNRENLTRHIARVACNGRIEGAVFRDAFRTRAFAPDQLLLVDAPPLEGAEDLGVELGMPRLDVMSNALRVLEGGKAPGADGEHPDAVAVRVDGHKLVIDEEDGRRIGLLIAAPRTIGTYVKEETAEKILAAVPEDAETLSLTPRLVSDVISTFSLFRADEVEVTVGPDGGRIRVGHEDRNTAAFEAPSLVAETEFTLLFGPHLVDVFSVLTAVEKAVLKVAGPESPVLVEDAGFRYVLAPRARGADE